MGQSPAIGDLIELIVTWKPPTGSVNVVTAANMLTRAPDGTEVVVPGDEVSDNKWHFIAATPIDQSGQWGVRVNATAGLINATEFLLDVARTRFDLPLAVP